MNLPNLIYELRQWLDLEPNEPLNAEVRALQKKPARLQAIIERLAGLLGAVAGRKWFRANYSGGSVILDAAKLGSAGGRALSYRDANLEDAVYAWHWTISTRMLRLLLESGGARSPSA